MKVLVACEFSGIVRDAFLERGHDAISCDLLPTERPGPHIQGDVTPLLREPWDLVIAHPPCTYLCRAGQRWLYEQSTGPALCLGKRWAAMNEAAAFFQHCLSATAPRVAVENPVMHKPARDLIGRDADYFLQPWMFGHGETKRTGLWVKNLPPLLYTLISDGRYGRVHSLRAGPERWRERSRTYTGIAAAMADQWGTLTE